MGKLKILVTGKDGQLGYALQELSENQFEFIWKFTDRSELDITNSINTQTVLKEFQPDWIINAAAYTDVDGAESNEEIAYKVNADGPYILAKSAKEIGAKLVHISTDYVFDGDKGQYSEEDATNPINEYGRTKLEGEQYLAKNSNDSLIIRTNVLYDYASNSNASFLNWIVHSLNDEKVINVVDDQINNPTWTMSLAIVIDRAIQTELNGFIHWGDADWISRYEFALKIAQSFNLKKDLIEPIKTAELKQTAIRPLKGGLSTIYAEKILNLEPPKIEHCLHQLKK